jgi:hypothetical protein
LKRADRSADRGQCAAGVRDPPASKSSSKPAAARAAWRATPAARADGPDKRHQPVAQGRGCRGIVRLQQNQHFRRLFHQFECLAHSRYPRLVTGVQ